MYFWLTIVLLNPDIFSLEKSVDPDQLAFNEAIRSDRILLLSTLNEKIHNAYN